MFLENFHKFIKYYGKGKFLSLCNFTILSIIAGLLELIGIALIYPFILFLINPSAEILQQIPILKHNNSLNIGLIIGFIAIFIFIVKNIFMIFIQYIQNKFVSDWKKSITSKYMQYYIYAPYKEIMKTSQTDKLYNIEVICNIAVDGFIMRGLNLLTNTVIITMILSLLFIKFPVPAIITLLFVTVTMFIQNKFFKKRTAILANTMGEKYKQYKISVMENITNIKELKILSAEQLFYDKYLTAENDYRETQTLQGFYNTIPPYIVEMLTIFALLILASILSLENLHNNSTLIASLAIVVASIFRIAPALNRIQSSIININSTRDFVKKINEEYEKCNLGNFKYTDFPNNEKLNFNNTISLKNICFSYNDSKPIIKNISFDINKGDFIGIIGLSGAGKSTLADVITGLLPIDSGEIIVDGIKLTQENYSKFRHIIGYVPQQINILDKSFKENVAWGCEQINDERVIKALKSAQIYDIVKEYPEGINSNIIIGSNGLSQGQKQRLAIARALYRDPEIIILDEATSALDVQVENEITEMLTNISKTKTIIAIAHRLSTLKACNKLIYMKDGQVIDIGTFEELSSRYADFANLVKLSSIK